MINNKYFLIILTVLFSLCISNNTHAQFISCNQDDCGTANPDWRLDGQSVVCEGETFLLFPDQSSPLDLIEEYRWIIYDDNFNILVEEIYTDITPLEYTFELPPDFECTDESVNFQVNLITSFTCDAGESCRNSLEPLTVELKPRASFDVDTKVCVGESVEFENTSCNGVDFEWDFGDGSPTSEAENPTHQYSNPGLYTVSLIAFNDCGESAPSFKTIRVIGLPEAQAEFIPDLDPICTPQTIFFQNYSINIDSIGNICPDDEFEWEITPATGWSFQSDFVMVNDSLIEIEYNETTWNTQVNFFAPGVYTIELTVDNICNQPDTWIEEIEVFERPSVSLGSIESICLSEDVNSVEVDLCELLDYSGTVCDFTWEILKDNEPFSTGDNYSLECFEATFTQAGAYQINIELEGCGCGTVNATSFFNIAEAGESIISSPLTSVCTNESPFTLTANAGGTWSSSPSGLINSNTGLIDPSELETSTVTFTFEPDECSEPSSIDLMFFEAPSVELETVESACDELSFTPEFDLDGTFDNIIWTAILEDGTMTPYNQNAAPSLTYGVGNHQLAVEVTGICNTITDTIDINVIASEAIDIIAPMLPICNTSSPINLEASPTGIWSHPNGYIDSDGFFDPANVPVNVPINLTYTIGQGTVCENSTSIEVVVTEAINVTINDDFVLCEDAAPFQLTANPSGGYWIGEGLDSMGLFNVQGLITDDIYTATYFYEDANGCTIQNSVEIIIEALPSITIDNLIELCETDMDINLLEVINFELTPNSGTLTFEGEGIINPNGIFNSQSVGANTGDTMTITAIYQLIDCRVVEDFDIVIIEKTEAQAGVDERLCVSDGFYPLNGIPANGFWREIAGNGAGLNPSTGELDLEEVGGGIHTYEYIIQEGTSCEDRDIVQIEIIDLSNVDAGQDIAICENSAPISLTGFPANGIWLGTNIDPTSGLFDPTGLAPGVYELTYQLTDASIEDCAFEDVVQITIEPLPIPLFEINGTACVNEVFELNNLSLAACNYEWDFGDGTPVSNLENPSHIYTQTGNYTITLTSYTCSNPVCSETYILNINVTEPPFASFNKSINEGCAPLEVSFGNQSFGSNPSYLWDFGNGQTSTDQNPPPVVFQQANMDTTYIISLAVTNDCGTVYYVDSVTVFPQPIVDFGVNEDEGCSPLPISFVNASEGNPETFAWYINGDFISANANLPDTVFTTTDTTITNYEILLISTNECGIDSFQRTIVVYPPNVEAFFHIDTLSGCAPLTIELTNYSTPGATITYDFGDGNGSAQADITHTFEEAGIYTITQSASNCGSDFETNQVEVFPIPEVSFSTADFVCVGQSISFTNSSIGIKGSSWDFGDGNSSEEDSPAHIYEIAGTYTVVLTGFSELNNCPAYFEKTVEVKGNPLVQFEPDTNNGCAPLTISFENLSEMGIVSEWDFGDGEASNLMNPTHTFETSGTYAVSLIGTDEFGCFEDTSIINIIVHEIPTSNFETDTDNYCATVDSVIINNLSIGGVQYYWNFSNGTTSQSFEPNQIFNSPENLAIELIVENEFSCRDTSSRELTILETPEVTAPLASLEGCPPYEVEFSQIANYTDLFEWDFGDGNTSSSDMPSHTYMDSDTFQISLIAGNTNGCPNDTFYQEVIVRPQPTSAFEIAEMEQCGFEDTIGIQNISSGALDYFWTDGIGNNFDNQFEPSILYPDTGSYTITLVSQNSFGCLDTTQNTVQILSSPIAQINANQLEGCVPFQVALEDISNYSDGNIWILDDGNFGNNEGGFNNTFEQDGTYEVSLIATHSNGCPNDTAYLDIQANPIPTSAFEVEDTIFCGLPTQLDITNIAIDTVSYYWDFGNGMTSNETEPSVVYQNPGDYLITEITTNTFNCSDTAFQAIHLYHQPSANITPDMFTACEGEPITFENLSTLSDSTILYFGDGNFAPINELFDYSYAEQGIYDLQIMASNSNICFDTLDLELAVNISDSPEADFDWEDLGNGNIQFTNQSIPLDLNTYQWDFKDGTFSNETSPSHEYFLNGYFDVTLTATNYNGCQDSISKEVHPAYFYALHIPNAFSPESGEGEVKLFKPKGVGLADYHMEVFSKWGKLVWESEMIDNEQPMQAWDGIILSQGVPAPQGVYTWRCGVEYVNGLKEVRTGVVHLLR